MVETPKWLTTKQAADLIGVSSRRVLQLLGGGELRGLQSGPRGSWRIMRADAERYRHMVERDVATATGLEGEDVHIGVLASDPRIERQTTTDAILGGGEEGDAVVWVHIIVRATGLVSADHIGLAIANHEIPTAVLPFGFSASTEKRPYDVSFLVAKQWATEKQNARVFIGSGDRRWFSKSFEVDFGLE